MAPQLLAVPNVAEGRDAGRIAAVQDAFTRGAVLLDRHSDADHDRTVFTLAAGAAPLRDSLLAGASQAVETLDMSGYGGLHPAVGALDVCPLVWLDPGDRGAARVAAIEVAAQIGGLGVPVFLYGELATVPSTPSAPTSATVGWLSSGCGWRGEDCVPTTGRACLTAVPV